MIKAEISWDRYLDKVRGGWVGKSLGGSVGHFEGTKRITRFRMRDLLTEGIVANDDLDIQLVWLDLLFERGVLLDGSELMAAWIERYDYNFGEYGFSRRNFQRGVRPPLSGRYANRYYKSGMGCAIRSEIWGMIAPGNPELAARYAETDGSMDHEGDAVDAERLLAAMEAEAFFCDDVPALLELGMRYARPGSVLERCMSTAVEGHRSGWPWEKVWQELRDEHSHPDCTYAPLNLGIIAMALLYGGGDMERTMTIAVNSGWDVDCTCSTTGALIGIVSGLGGMASAWRDYIGDSVVTLARPRRVFASLTQVAVDTCAVGAAVARAGLTRTRITGVPASAPALPEPRREATLRIRADYPQAPEIRPGETMRVDLCVVNRGGAVSGELRLAPPKGLLVDAERRRVRVPLGGELRVPVLVSTDTRSAALADANILGCAFSPDGETAVETSFGVCGAACGLALGPYFDSYDDWLDRSALPPRRVLRTATDTISLPELGEEWGNHRVDLRRAYIAEDFSDPGHVRALFAGGRPVSLREDCFRVSDACGLQGSCCVYLLFEVVSETARDVQLFLGSTDPFAMWWNGRRTFTQALNRFWFPNNDVVDVALRAGTNLLLLKVLRSGADNCLSFVFRHRPVLQGYDSCPFVTDLSWGIPGGRA